jgi:hypothetical protein
MAKAGELTRIGLAPVSVRSDVPPDRPFFDVVVIGF